MNTGNAVAGMKRVLAWMLLLILPLVLSLLGLAPPRPEPADAPAGRFSAGRALLLLKALASGDEPRPLGSPAAALTRERAAAEFRRLGYAVREEPATACDDAGTCKAVRNLVAELPGKDRGSAVALVAHYDSVPAGPGISDDLSGVASLLEVARILKAEPRHRHSVLFLITDGEEAGLLGARAFVDGSPEAGRVRAVVNLEARGTSGPSVLFETGPDNTPSRTEPRSFRSSPSSIPSAIPGSRSPSPPWSRLTGQYDATQNRPAPSLQALPTSHPLLVLPS